MWLQNAIFSLAAAGIYSIIIVLLRVPWVTNLIDDKSIFKSALIIHVNLSVLVWFLSIACYICSLARIKSFISDLLSYVVCFSMILMIISPFASETNAVMNNYIPMLENIIFVIGLSLFLTSILIFSINTLFLSFIKVNFTNYGERIIFITKLTISLMFIIACICFFLSFLGLQNLIKIVPLDIDFYYEMLYWSGGHLLQFIYTQIFMFSLLLLAEIWKKNKLYFTDLYEMLLAANFLLAITLLLGHFFYDISDSAFKGFFTYHMIYSAGICPTIFIILLTSEIIFIKERNNIPNFISSIFTCSIILFLFGGLIGLAISGVNVKIPAHYHGSIVAITISLIGLVYLIIFKNELVNKYHFSSDSCINFVYNDNSFFTDYSKFVNFKLVNSQILIMFIGQTLHITGLALAGGYGVLRKDPSGNIANLAKFYMGLVGIGGVLAIIGGLMFIYICGKKLIILKNKF